MSVRLVYSNVFRKEAEDIVYDIEITLQSVSVHSRA
jgi:hypothetical protein